MHARGRRQNRSIVVLLSCAALPFFAGGCDEAAGTEPAVNSSVEQGTAGVPDLSGTWVLNPEESERPRGLRGPHGPGRPGLRHRDGQDPARSGPRPASPPRLEIVQGEESVRLTRHRGRTVTLHTDGRTTRREVRDGRQIEIRAEWTDEGLVVSRSLPEAGSLTETFRLADDGDRLHVLTTIAREGQPEPVEFLRVYDRATGGS